MTATEPATGELLSMLSAAGVTVYSFPKGGPFDYSRELSECLCRQLLVADLLEIHGVFDFPALIAAALAVRAGRPYVVHPHGSLDPFDLKKHPMRKRIIGRTAVRWMLSKSAAVVTTSDEERRRLHTYGARADVRVIGLPYRVAPALQVAGSGGGSDSAPCVGLFMGRVDYKKGLGHLIDALALLGRSGHGIQLNVAGAYDTSYGRELREVVVRAGLTNSINFLGHLRDDAKVQVLRDADFFLLPSDNENYGLVLVEAAAAGLPMILSDEVYLAEYLKDIGAAIVCARTPLALADGILALKDPRLRKRMSQDSRRAYETVFDYSRLVRQHADFCMGVVATQPKGPGPRGC